MEEPAPEGLASEEREVDWQPEPWIPETTFGGRLLMVRRELGMTQRAAAERCGFSNTTWNNWEHGTRPEGMNDVVEAIHQGLRVKRSWLMWGNSQSACWGVVPPMLGQGDLFDAAMPAPELEVIVTSAAG